MATFSDDFTGTGDLSSDWTRISGGSLARVADKAHGSDMFGDLAVWNTPCDSNDQHVEVEFDFDQPGQPALFICNDGSFSYPFPTGYYLVFYTGGNLYQFVRNGTVITDSVATGFSGGVHTIRLSHDGAGAVTYSIDGGTPGAVYTDSTPLTDLQVGFGWGFFGFSGENADADNFAAGDNGAAGPANYNETNRLIDITATITSTDSFSGVTHNDETNRSVDIAASVTSTDTYSGDAGGALYSDDFNRADGAPGSDWTLMSSGNYAITSNQLVKQAGGSDYIIWAGGALPSPDHYIQAKVYNSSVEYNVLCARSAGGESSCYQGFWSVGGAFWQISRSVGGASTLVGSSATESAPADGTVVRLEVEGTEIRLYANGVLKASGTNTEITTGTAVGFAGTHIGTGTTFDDFEAGELGAPIGPIDETNRPINIVATVTSTDVGPPVHYTDTNLAVNITATITSTDAVHIAIIQEGFRWRNDNGSETTATWKAAQDTNTSLAIASPVRLRVLVDNPDPAAYTLYYKKTTDSTWLLVPVGSGGGDPVYVTTSANITADGEDTTAQLTAPTGKTTADFAVGRMWDDENGIDIVPGDYAFAEPFNSLSRWTPARQRSVGFFLSPAPTGWCQDFTPASLDNVEPPNDIAIVSSQVWLGCGSQNYGDTTIRCNQPMEFASGGTIEVDVWVPPFGEGLRGWPHLTVTADPYTCPSAKSDNSGGPTARYGFEVRFNHGSGVWEGGFRPAPQTVVWDEYAETLDTDGGIGRPINSTPHVMTHVRIEFDHSHIDIYADDALWYAHDWTLPTELTSGWIYLASHNHATIKYGFGANNYSIYDNLRFSGTVLPLRRCWKVPDPVTPITVSDPDSVGLDGVDIGWYMPVTVTILSVPAGVTSARLLCTTGAFGGFVDGSTTLTYSLNGNTAHANTYPEWNGTTLTNTGVSLWSIPVTLSELVTGSNTVSFTHSTISGPTPYLSNVQLLTEGGS